MPRLCPTLNNCYFIFIYFPIPEIHAYVYYPHIPTQTQVNSHIYVLNFFARKNAWRFSPLRDSPYCHMNVLKLLCKILLPDWPSLLKLLHKRNWGNWIRRHEKGQKNTIFWTFRDFVTVWMFVSTNNK